MNPAAGALCYDATPALHIPLRFLLTAPLFGCAAGLLLLVAPEALASRWEPAAFALTHLLAVGFMLMVMFGALFQILPVIGGVAIPGRTWFASLVHAGLTLGAVLLPLGLGAGLPVAIRAGGILLGLVGALFVSAVALALWGSGIALDTQRDLRIALSGIGMAILLGATLTQVLAAGLALPLGALLELHVGWALLGGAGVLLAATSWIVVPMFQITPAYPRVLTRGWAVTVCLALIAWSAAVAAGAPRLAFALLLVPLLMVVAFASATLLLQRDSRRGAPDATTRAFRLAMPCFLAGVGCLLAARHSPADAWAVAAGVLLLYGGFTGVMQGMLYRIVPFLCWLDLSQSMRRAPNVKKLQPDRPIALQARMHVAALATLLLAVGSAEPLIARAAGVLVTIDFGWLLWNMTGVLRAHSAARGAAHG